TTEEASLRLASCDAREAEARDRTERAKAIICKAHVDKETTRRKRVASEEERRSGDGFGKTAGGLGGRGGGGGGFGKTSCGLGGSGGGFGKTSGGLGGSGWRGSVVAALTEREHALTVQKKAEKKKDMHFPMHRNAFVP
ncbi:hypothetical protein ACHAW5_010308, partial [Stephanodiscus triporus]